MYYYKRHMCSIMHSSVCMYVVCVPYARMMYVMRMRCNCVYVDRDNNFMNWFCESPAVSVNISLVPRPFPTRTFCACAVKRGGGKQRVWGIGLHWNFNCFHLWSNTYTLIGLNEHTCTVQSTEYAAVCST